MIQTYRQIFDFVKSFNSSINDQYGQVQKLYSTPHLICIILRFRGQTRFLYIGRGNHYEGIWEHSSAPPAEFRIRGRYLEYLRKFLMGARIGKILIHSTDRAIIIPYFSNKQQNTFGFFWKGRFLNFFNIIREDKPRIFKSWIGREEEFSGSGGFEVFEGLDQMDIFKENSNVSILEYFQKLGKELEGSEQTGKKKKFLDRKLQKIQMDIDKLNNSAKIWPLIQTGDFIIGDRNQIILEGLKFKFDPSWNEYKKRGKVFEKLKDFQKAQILLKARFEEVLKERQSLGKEKRQISQVRVIEPLWVVKKEEKSPPNVNFYQTGDCRLKCALGLDAQANDFLRTKWAGKEDWWFHLEGYSSGHLFVKGLFAFDKEVVAAFGSLIRDHANIQITQIPLIFTLVKYLRGVKGKAGAVTYVKEKYLKVDYNKNWQEYILKL